MSESVKSDQGTKVSESIEKMLICLLSKTEKNCKNCCDNDACSFLTQAVFTIGYRQNSGIKIYNT